MLSCKGKVAAVVTGLIGMATISQVTFASRDSLTEKLSVWYYKWKYGRKTYTEFYDIADLTLPHPHYTAPIINLSSAQIEPCDPQKCDCHLKADVDELFEAIRRRITDEEGAMHGAEPRILSGQMMIKTSFSNHFGVQMLLGKLRKSPSPAEALRKIRGE